MKSPRTVYTEGALYVVIAAGSPFAEFLISDRLITSRSVAAVSVAAIVAGANALKAFLSQSIANGPEEPQKMLMVNTPDAPGNVQEVPKPPDQ